MNKNSREMATLNRKSRKKDGGKVYATHTDHGTNGKKHTVTITSNDHSPFAFMEPAEAIASKKQRGIRSWRVTGKHPAHKKVED